MASSTGQHGTAAAPLLLAAESEAQGKSPLGKRKEPKSPLTNDLLIASRKGHSKDVARLLDQEGGVAAVTVLDKHERNCLHLACHYGHLDTVLVIMSRGLFDINCTSKKGFTPLHEACAEGHISVVHLLLAFGAVVMARSRDGWTSLMSAAYNGNVLVAKALLAAGSEINAKNKHGFSALHVAAWRGHTSVVEMLVKEGAHVVATTVSGKTAMQLAQEEGHHETTTILQAAAVRDSEEPVYRIAALEGQLRIYSERIQLVQQQHEEQLSKEREKAEQKFQEMKDKLTRELKALQSQLALLQDKVEKHKKDRDKKEDGNKKQPSLQVVDSKENEPVKKQRKEKHPSQSSERFLRDIVATPTIRRATRQKSSSQEMLDKLGLDAIAGHPEARAKAKSLGDPSTAATKTASNGSSFNKLSITKLVAESIKNPESIASIRRELKADGLTPKIQKKFQHSQLSSMPTTSDT